MKKICILLSVLLAMCLFISCGNDKGKADETSGETNGETTAQTDDISTEEKENKNGVLTINPDDYYNCVVFELPEGDFRDAAVEHMRKQASLEWVCSKDFKISEEWANWGVSLEFKEGKTYTGIPYSDTKVSYDEFLLYTVDGTFTSESSKWKEVPGNACMSSVFNSVQQFDPKVAGVSNNLMPSYTKMFRAKICGEYTVPADVKTTNEIITANTPDAIYEAYSQLKKGDLIITKDDNKDMSHIRMLVEEPTIFKNAAGKIVFSRSSVKTIEQTNMFDQTRKDGVMTTWYVDHVYSFSDIYNSNYLPITLEIYSKDRSECEIPYLCIDNEITADILSKRTMVSSVKSNFPIRFVYMDILDKSGEQIKRVVVNDMADSYTVNLRNHATKVFDGLENGDYTLVITSGIAIGNAELARVDFTYSK